MKKGRHRENLKREMYSRNRYNSGNQLYLKERKRRKEETCPRSCRQEAVELGFEGLRAKLYLLMFMHWGLRIKLTKD